jgi:hypothetical protein
MSMSGEDDMLEDMKWHLIWDRPGMASKSTELGWVLANAVFPELTMPAKERFVDDILGVVATHISIHAENAPGF